MSDKKNPVSTQANLFIKEKLLKNVFIAGLNSDNQPVAEKYGEDLPLEKFTDIEKFPFGSLEQGNDSIMDFYRKVKKYYKLLGNVEELYLKNHFIRGLSRDNQLEAGRCGLDLPLDELVARLSALENLTNQDK
ncbi:hypothetical protein Glove_73g18 [Diversispora epigaea]|uniref:Uncharacterized protein n=1 Tax=Diversispora epigaea TaxID=1348612 RepID=A0A397JJA0_9GLOM|nr:hypothetical protein Glove_73g18 [Diversispora epigaea]